MSYTYTLSTFVNGADVLFQFKEAMKASGWIVLASGNGTSYNPSGDNIPDLATMGIARSWFVLRCPSAMNGVFRQLSFQNSSTVVGINGLNIRIKYSYSNGFSGGSPSPTVVSSATDEQLIAGGGTDISPSFGGWGGGSVTGIGTVNRTIFAIGDINEGHSFISYTIGKNSAINLVSTHSFLMDKMHLSSHSIDQDGYVFFMANAGGWQFFNQNSFTTGPFCWWNKGNSTQKWARAWGLNNSMYNSSQTVDGNVGPDPWTGRDKLYSLFYGSDVSSYPDCAIKGRSHLLLYSTSSALATDGYTTTYNSGSKLLLFNGSSQSYFTIPWNNTTTSLV